MPSNIFGSTFGTTENKIDTTLFVEKHYIKLMYIESNVEVGIESKSEIRNKNLPELVSIRGAASENYVENMFNDPSKKLNFAHIDFRDKNRDNVRFYKNIQFYSKKWTCYSQILC